MDIRSTIACSVHRYVLPHRLRLEVTGCKHQAHNSRGSKNNEHDVLHGVTSLSKRIKWHWHSALGSEEARCECQTHHSHSTKNNEHDALHGVIVLLKSCSWHWNPPLLCVSVSVIRIALPYSSLSFSRIIHSRI